MDLQRAHIADDNSLIALWELQRSKNVAQATKTLEGLRLLPANILLDDAEHIAWQVTGSYPNRRNSSGQFPSAGWDNSVVWEGYADPMLYPYDQDPQQGWLSAANQRLTQPMVCNYPAVGPRRTLHNNWLENLLGQALPHKILHSNYLG